MKTQPTKHLGDIVKTVLREVCVCVCVCVCTQLLSHVQLCAAPWIVAARLLYPWNFPGKNTLKWVEKSSQQQIPLLKKKEDLK